MGDSSRGGEGRVRVAGGRLLVKLTCDTLRCLPLFLRASPPLLLIQLDFFVGCVVPTSSCSCCMTCPSVLDALMFSLRASSVLFGIQAYHVLPSPVTRSRRHLTSIFHVS